jgi:hypothetical protein
MPDPTREPYWAAFIDLIANADLRIGFVNGKGLGAVLLTVIALAFLRSTAFRKVNLLGIVRAWKAGR